jgi:Phospholipase_D-nuclease N-terminal
MIRLTGLLILVIDVVLVIDILKGNSDDNERKMLWIIAVVFLPVLGPILYYFVGKK